MKESGGGWIKPGTIFPKGKRWGVFLAGLLAGLALAFTALAGADEGPVSPIARVDEKLASSVPEVTAEGEVVYLLCYLADADGGHGPAHAKCAAECLGRGSPAGFLSKGQVYLLLGRDAVSLKELAIRYAGTTIVLTGTPIETAGMKAILVKKIKALGAAELEINGGSGAEKHPASYQGGGGSCH